MNLHVSFVYREDQFIIILLEVIYFSTHRSAVNIEMRIHFSYYTILHYYISILFLLDGRW